MLVIETCKRCRGRGIVFESCGHDDVTPGTCESCLGQGKIVRSVSRIPHGEGCSNCGSKNVRFVSIQSTEPHGETFTDEGYKCFECGNVQMDTVSDISKQYPTTADVVNELNRSLNLIRSLNPAHDPPFRFGRQLAAGQPKNAEEVA